MMEQDVPALTKSSTVVARAKVISSQPRWTSDGARIVTDTTLELLEPWKGAPGKRLTVMQPGGVVGEVGQKVAGAARFQVGEEVVVFLEPRGERFSVAGMTQGVFHVQRSSDGKSAFARQDLEEALVLDAVTRQPLSGAQTVLTLEQLKAQVAQVVASDASPDPASPRLPTSTKPPLVTP
jgi:hypothetical protein